jgi:hypothetical protein
MAQPIQQIGEALVDIVYVEAGDLHFRNLPPHPANVDLTSKENLAIDIIVAAAQDRGKTTRHSRKGAQRSAPPKRRASFVATESRLA